MLKHAALALVIMMGTLAGACGPAPQPEAPPSGGVMPVDGAATPPTEAKPAEGTPPADAKPEAMPEEAPAAPAAAGPAQSTPISASAMEEDLKKIGIDLKKIPELGKLSPAQKKKVMPLLQKSLGMDACTGCHVEGDFKKETRNLKIAREMWNHFVVPLRSEKGGVLFCDSCHGGNKHVLNRADKKAVEKFMDEEYEHKTTLAAKGEVECSTCHGDAMEPKIIEKLWKIAN